MNEFKPDTYLECVELRHKASDEKRIAKLRELMKDGWKGRPLLVMKNDKGAYEVLTGCHRAEVAMQLSIPIPVVIIPDDALTPDQRKRVLSGEEPYETLPQFFADAGLPVASELMAQEMRLSLAEPVCPTVKERTTSKKRGIRRVNAEETEDPNR